MNNVYPMVAWAFLAFVFGVVGPFVFPDDLTRADRLTASMLANLTVVVTYGFLSIRDAIRERKG